MFDHVHDADMDSLQCLFHPPRASKHHPLANHTINSKSQTRCQVLQTYLLTLRDRPRDILDPNLPAQPLQCGQLLPRPSALDAADVRVRQGRQVRVLLRLVRFAAFAPVLGDCELGEVGEDGGVGGWGDEGVLGVVGLFCHFFLLLCFGFWLLMVGGFLVGGFG